MEKRRNDEEDMRLEQKVIRDHQEFKFQDFVEQEKKRIKALELAEKNRQMVA